MKTALLAYGTSAFATAEVSLVPATVGAHPPDGAATVPLTDHLPPVDLELLWRNDTVSPAIRVIVTTAQTLATSRGWAR